MRSCARESGLARAPRRPRLPRATPRRAGGNLWRGDLQYGDAGVSRDSDRPVVSRADRGDDVPVDRQLRDQRGGRRVAAAVGQRAHRPRVLADRLELPLGGGPRRVPQAARDRRPPGDRHPRPHAPPPRPRRPGRDHLVGRARSGGAARACPRAAGPRRTRPRRRGHRRRALRLERGRLQAWARLRGTAAAALQGRRLRLWNQAQHPAPAPDGGRSRHGRARGDARGGGARDEARRRLPLERAGRPGGRALPDRVGPRAPRPPAGLRDLSGPPDHGARQRRQHLQAQVRPPRREPSREGPRDGQGRDHRAESRVRGRARVGRPPRVGADAREPQRRHVRGARPPRVAGVLGAVSSGGVAGPARRQVPVPPVHLPYDTEGRLSVVMPKYLISYRKTEGTGQKPEWTSFTTTSDTSLEAHAIRERVERRMSVLGEKLWGNGEVVWIGQGRLDDVLYRREEAVPETSIVYGLVEE